jgi:hypothetical protein
MGSISSPFGGLTFWRGESSNKKPGTMAGLFRNASENAQAASS